MADQLANPRMPADHGLPALALLMKLQAGFFMVYAGFFVVQLILSGGRGFGRGTEVALMLLVVVAGMIRGGVHMSAAGHLARRSPQSLLAVRRYIIMAGVTSAGMLLATLPMDLPLPMVFGLAVLLLFWPATLGVLVLMRPSIRRMFEAAETFDVELVPSDRSIEGAGVLMTYLAAVGLAIGLYGLFVFLQSGGASGLGAVFAIALVLLVVRAAVHLRAGIAAMGGLAPEAFQRRTNTYFGWGLATVGGVALALLVASGGRGLFSLILILVLVASLLMLWPILLRGFAMQTMMDDLGDDGGTIPFGPAPDRGLTALGYLLVLFGGAQAAIWVVQLLAVGAFAALPGLGGAAFQGVAGPELWITPILAAVTLWAGRELVTMSARYRLAAVVYAAVQLVGTLLSLALDDAGLDGLGDLRAPTTLLALVVAVIVPILALFLTGRRLPEAAAESTRR